MTMRTVTTVEIDPPRDPLALRPDLVWMSPETSVFGWGEALRLAAGFGPGRFGRAEAGFAEWVAYRVLGDYGYTHGQERMCSRSDIYGQGLRRILEIEDSQGMHGVYRACRSVS